VVEWKVAHRFTVEGDPVGYYALGKHPNWKRKEQYHTYKRAVQRVAELAGVGRLVASIERPLRIHTTAWFRTRVHPDPENVRKGICDALFYRRPSQHRGNADKYTGGSFPPPLYDRERPRVEVVIEEPATIVGPMEHRVAETRVCGHARGSKIGSIEVQCELEPGHHGEHRMLYGNSVLEWM